MVKYWEDSGVYRAYLFTEPLKRRCILATKTLDKLTIVDDFMFGAVMRDPARCKTLLEFILNIKIRKIEYLELQKDIKHTYDAKGIRLDVYVEDENNTVYDIEMQTTDKKNLPKRMRYYQGMIDLNVIDKGEEYTALKKSFVIFICTYDPFGKGRYIYTFDQTAQQDRSVVLEDEAIKIVLNTKGTVGDISEELKATLEYMDGQLPTTDYAKELETAVEEVKASEDWRREYMTLFLRDRENVRLGRYIDKVEMIRHNMKDHPVNTISSFVILPETKCNEVISLINTHPDWDDEKVAEQIDWS